MTDQGFYGDYGSMRASEAEITEARNALGSHLSDFRHRASLDSAIPSISGDKIPVSSGGPMGPNLDELETMMAQVVREAYGNAVDAVDEFLKETHKQLDDLSHDIADSIAEYERRDAESASDLPNVQPPR